MSPLTCFKQFIIYHIRSRHYQASLHQASIWDNINLKLILICRYYRAPLHQASLWDNLNINDNVNVNIDLQVLPGTAASGLLVGQY